MRHEKTAEQQARDMLERMGIEDAQSWTAGDVVELANLIADHAHLKSIVAFIEASIVDEGGGGELFPVGPSDIIYAADDSVLECVPPWHWLKSTGGTFLEAVENGMNERDEIAARSGE